MGDYGDEITSYLGKRFRELRTAQVLSLADVAERAKVHRSTIHLVERGQRGITVATAARLAKALGISLSELIAEAEKYTKA